MFTKSEQLQLQGKIQLGLGLVKYYCLLIMLLSISTFRFCCSIGIPTTNIKLNFGKHQIILKIP